MDDSNQGDPVIDTNVVPVISEHVVSKSRQQRLLRPEDTTTGLTGRALTIKEGVLAENRTYALLVHVQSRGDCRLSQDQPNNPIRREQDLDC